MIQQSNTGHIPRENHNSKKSHVPQCSLQLYLQSPGHGNNLKCPSTEEWIKKMWYIYTMEYYSTIKTSEIGSFVETWMDLETVIHSEVCQKEKNKYCILTYICGI